MQKGKVKRSLILTIILVALVASAATCAYLTKLGKGKVFPSSEPNYNYGYYTFDREMLLSDGSTATFYESGDEYFHYSHDAEGYILIRDNDAMTLEYAVNVGGRPVSSGVSYLADSELRARVPKMTVSDIDFESNPDLRTEYPVLDEVHVEPLLAGNSSGTSSVYYNLVIYIKFSGESFTPGDELVKMFNSNSSSLKSYYRAMSNNTVTIESVFPYSNGAIFVYNAPNSRSSYNIDGSGDARRNAESALLTAAVAAAKSHFDLSDKDLDVNDDGYLDSLSFIISGASSNTWGSLLWPHSWNLDSIDGSGYSSINGVTPVKVGNYSFNFATALNVGVLCHEMGHVLGAPDLYHYNYDYVPVGNWDLMQFNNDTPQYMLTYMREKYIGGIGTDQIKSITHNGVYSLAPVNSAQAGGTLAYKIRVNRNEYFMVEYRKAASSGFDSTLPGSGLIVYRIKEPKDFGSSLGNQEATYHGTGSKADEVYVFRPMVTMTGSESSTSLLYSHSKNDIDYGYLSPDNPRFSTIGTVNVSTKYSYGNIFYSDGTNSGIVITAQEINGDRIEFSVTCADFAKVNNDYFSGKITLGDIKMVDNAEYAGLSCEVNFGEIDTAYLNSVKLELVTASSEVIAVNTLKYAEFLSAYNGGTRKFVSKFVYYDKGNQITGPFKSGAFTGTDEPVKVVMKVIDSDGDEIVIGEKSNIVKEEAWSTILNTKTEPSIALVASARLTAAITKNGTVEVSGNRTAGQWAARGTTNAVGIAAGYSHVLVVRNTLRVEAFGDNVYGELNVDNWRDIKAVAAGRYTSYGLKTDGTVVAAGLNDYGQCDVSGWSNIVAISAGETHVVGLRSDGRLVAAGSSYNGATAIEDIRNVESIACGTDFTAILHKNGRVEVVGYFASSGIDDWQVKKIAAGSNHIIGIKEDGTVVAAGDNSYGQCFTSGLIDIIDGACGLKHSAYLRQDGVVEFRGNADADYPVNTNIGNLLFEEYKAVTRLERITVGGAGGSRHLIDLGASKDISVGYAPQNPTYYRMDFTVADESVISLSITSYTQATITALKEGATTVTVSAHGAGAGVDPVTITIEVKMSRVLSGLKFNETARRIPADESMIIAAVPLPYGAEYVGDITYESLDTDVLTVDSRGMVTAVGSVGDSAVIRATLGYYTAECTVTIVEGADISLSVITKESRGAYRYGESLDLDGYTLEVTIDGVTEEVRLFAEMIDPDSYDPEDIVTINQTVVVNYLGQTATFTATVKDYATHITVTTEPKLNYLYGEALSDSGAFTVHYKSGATTSDVAFLKTNYKGYRADVTGMQVVTYEYTDYNWNTNKISYEFIISVVDYAVALEYNPVKATYLYGELFNKNEIATLTMASGRTRAIELGECSVRDKHGEAVLGDDYYELYSLRIGQHILEITYTEVLTSAVFTCEVGVTVAIMGEIAVSGSDSSTDVYYFERGGSLGLTVMVVQSSGAIEVAADDTAGIYYILNESEELGGGAFDSEILTAREIKLTINVVKQTLLAGGTISSGIQELYTGTLAIEGADEIAEDGEGNKRIEFMGGYPTTYTYGADISLKLKVYYKGGNVLENVEPHEVRYDNTAVGEITYTAIYFGYSVTATLTINDYSLGLEPIDDAECEYRSSGEYLPDVYTVMASGNRNKLERKTGSGEGYTISANNRLNVLGERIVSITYGEFEPVTFKLKVVDVYDHIDLVVAPRTVYRLGESFNPASKYKIVMRSGVEEVIEYNSDRFYMGYTFDISEAETEMNGIRLNVYYVYDSNNHSVLAWYGYCSVHDYVRELAIDVRNSKFEYGVGEKLSLTVRMYLASGSQRNLAASEYVTDFNSGIIGKQTVTVTYVDKYGEYYYIQAEVTVVDKVVNVRIITEPNVKSYSYGAILQWLGAAVTVSYNSGNVLYRNEEIPANLEVEYSTLKSGERCAVVVKAGDVSASFNIRVGAASAVLATASVSDGNNDIVLEVNDAKREIISESAVGISDIAACFKEFQQHLTLYYKSADGSLLYSKASGGEIQWNGGTRTVRSFDKVVLANRDGVEVFVYVVYLKGDMTGDGSVTAADLKALADELAQTSGYNIHVKADCDGNGKVNLTDLVKWARKVSGKPAPAPFNEGARGFISDVKPRNGKEDDDNVDKED